MLDKTEIRALLGRGGFAAGAEQTCLTADRSDTSDVAQSHKDFLNVFLIYCNMKLHGFYLCSYQITMKITALLRSNADSFMSVPDGI